MSLECRIATPSLVVSVAVLLSGCWMPPSANVRPAGEPRVVEHGIEVDWMVHSARVESVDPAARTVGLNVQDGPLVVCNVGPGVHNWGDIHVGDQVRAKIREVLTVYVGPANESGVRSRSPDARVLVADPSYRLLTVQFPNGGTATFKIGLGTRMKGIEAGDFVAIRPVAAVKLRVRQHSSREASSRSSASATLVR
jgi:hypothetical protein